MKHQLINNPYNLFFGEILMVKKILGTMLFALLLTSVSFASNPGDDGDMGSSNVPTASPAKVSDNFSLSSTLRFRYMVEEPYTKQTSNYFYFQRAYVTMKYSFNDKIKARLSLDFDHKNRVALKSTSGSTVLANDGTRARIKYAYLQFSDFLGIEGVDAVFGNYEQPGPQSYHNTIENCWLDRYYAYGYSSAVTGAMLTYNFPSKWGYARLAVANMNGYGYAGDDNKAKNIISDVWVTPPGTGISVFGWTMMDYYAASDNEAKNTIFGGGAEYAMGKTLDVGVEANFMENSVTEIKGSTFMGYVNYNVLPELMLVGQIGQMDNNTDVDDDEIVMILGGLNYQIIGDTHLMFNVINEGFDVAGESQNNMRYNLQLLINF
ncbi:MAG: hypothetical protein CVV23_10860 [Ignavibacteriae bacterium HGW-Ignavibacteriae-2]|jgi:hypothetical protein|nr:MAG: hypothetical protein CVV23_10860 [Ignavibacteriae bacterium HGW-Ignavibacteriae-2]